MFILNPNQVCINLYHPEDNEYVSYANYSEPYRNQEESFNFQP